MTDPMAVIPLKQGLQINPAFRKRRFLTNTKSVGHILLVRAAERNCALDISCVIETMRPLPVVPVAGAPPFVCGLSIIRGTPIPVVALPLLFGSHAGSITRFVMVRTGARRIALAVEKVLGVFEHSSASLSQMPSLLQDATENVVEAIGRTDSELLLVLNLSRLVPDDVFPSLAHATS